MSSATFQQQSLGVSIETFQAVASPTNGLDEFSFDDGAHRADHGVDALISNVLCSVINATEKGGAPAILQDASRRGSEAGGQTDEDISLLVSLHHEHAGSPALPTSTFLYPAGAAPYNAVTGITYTGRARKKLLKSGFEDARWVTAQQAREQGWEIMQGEVGTSIRVSWISKSYQKLYTKLVVFNIDQVLRGD
eukprot:3467000-Rhodomonas_salina.3